MRGLAGGQGWTWAGAHLLSVRGAELLLSSSRPEPRVIRSFERRRGTQLHVLARRTVPRCLGVAARATSSVLLEAIYYI